jgi:hypothetical protein
LARSGNVENPERNWSEWKKVTPNSGNAGVPAARFIQWKAVLEPGARVGSVGINYLPVNIAPVVDEIAVEPGARATQSGQQPGQPQQITINLPSAQSGSPMCRTLHRTPVRGQGPHRGDGALGGA